jgi:hypothetical protein
MKKIETFEDAKQAVAEKHGIKTFPKLITECKLGHAYGGKANLPHWQDAYTEAAELYMRHAVNEAVRNDRDRLFNDNEEFEYCKFLIYDYPLPFPEEA